jgi:hypothetical protein
MKVLRQDPPRIKEFHNLNWLRQHGYGAARPLVGGIIKTDKCRCYQFLIVEYITGTKNLDDALLELPSVKRLALLQALAHQIRSLHQAGFIHHDLFPRNILISVEHWMAKSEVLTSPLGPQLDNQHDANMDSRLPASVCGTIEQQIDIIERGLAPQTLLLLAAAQSLGMTTHTPQAPNQSIEGGGRHIENTHDFYLIDCWKGGPGYRWRGPVYDLACLFLDGAELFTETEQKIFFDIYLNEIPRSQRERLLHQVQVARLRLIHRLEKRKNKTLHIPKKDWLIAPLVS